jgi:hypothetical protein
MSAFQAEEVGSMSHFPLHIFRGLERSMVLTYHTIWSSGITERGLVWIEQADLATSDEFRFCNIDERGEYHVVTLSRKELGAWVKEHAEAYQEAVFRSY